MDYLNRLVKKICVCTRPISQPVRAHQERSRMRLDCGEAWKAHISTLSQNQITYGAICNQDHKTLVTQIFRVLSAPCG